MKGTLDDKTDFNPTTRCTKQTPPLRHTPDTPEANKPEKKGGNTKKWGVAGRDARMTTVTTTRSVEWENEHKLEDLGEFTRRIMAEFGRCAERRFWEARIAAMKGEHARAARASARAIESTFAAAVDPASAAGKTVGRQFRVPGKSNRETELAARIHGFEILSDGDSFVSYTVRSTYGEIEAVVCRRFRHFKDLQKVREGVLLLLLSLLLGLSHVLFVQHSLTDVRRKRHCLRHTEGAGPERSAAQDTSRRRLFRRGCSSSKRTLRHLLEIR
jgi:hypothetical protein